MTSGVPFPVESWGRLQRWSLAAAALGILVGALGAVASPTHFFRAYLVAYNFWLGITLGSMVLLMVQYLTGGAWGLLLRRILEASVGTVPVLIVLFSPLIFGIRQLYIWAAPASGQEPTEWAQKSQYLNVPFFIGRAGVYFLVWLILSTALRRWSKTLERGQFSGTPRRFRLASAWGLVAYGLTITFASVDWIMSLEPEWYSTIYPPLFAVGQILSGMAFAIAALALCGRFEPLAAVIRKRHWRDVGNLLLAFIMCWAYLSFSQFLLIWVENMPEEIPWYLLRTRGGWQWIAMALVAFMFAIPFLLLLSRDVKEKPSRLAMIAMLVLALYFVNLYWWIEAAFPDGVSFYWLLDVAVWIGLGGVWMWWFVQKLRSRSLLPIEDPYFSEYLPVEEHDA